MINNPICWVLHFLGFGHLAAAGAGVPGPLVQAKVGSPPDIVHKDGLLEIALAATSEAETNCAYMADVLPFRVQDIQQVRIVASCSANLGTGTEVSFGLVSAGYGDPDQIAEAIIWKVLDDNSVVLESDDNATNVDDVDTGVVLGTTLREFVWDFEAGVLPRSPLEGGSVGARAHILASVSNDVGHLRRVCTSQVFTLGAYSGGLQFIAQIRKASGTDASKLWIKRVEITLKNTLAG